MYLLRHGFLPCVFVLYVTIASNGLALLSQAHGELDVGLSSPYAVDTVNGHWASTDTDGERQLKGPPLLTSATLSAGESKVI